MRHILSHGRLPLFVVLALSLFAVLPSTARAHGSLKSSTPAAASSLTVVPRELRLVFTEAPALAFSRLELLDASGTAVALSPVRLAAETRRALVADIRGTLAAGTYTVVWQIAGDDGHPVRGRYTFTVASGAKPTAQMSLDTSPPSAAAPAEVRPEAHHDPASMPQGASFGVESVGYVAIRALLYLGLLMAIGAGAFQGAVLHLLQRRHGADSLLLASARHGAARIGMLGTAFVAVAAVLRMGAQSYAMHSPGATFDPQLVRAMLMETVWGRGWLLQIGGTVVAAAGFRSAIRGTGGWGLAVLGVLALALTPALSGHAAATPERAGLAIVADTLHVIGAGGWLGSLLVVLVAGLPVAMRLPDEERGAAVAELFNAFSPTALLFAGLVAATGVFAAWLHVSEVSALWQTGYGRTLLAKLALLSVVGGTGAYNWLRVKPTISTVAGTARMKSLAQVELLVGVLVLIVTAVLVATPTPMDMRGMEMTTR
ncbi:MAG: copper resistance protein CopC [Gemmatimonadaceae bacterium]|nr:copper resistance protein CopC [Gemmatimonas sp. UBA7669]MBX9856174.1 copper resistance protein CopC [Gemmatimonadaceae bacterium]